jgi:hypothetical protein
MIPNQDGYRKTTPAQKREALGVAVVGRAHNHDKGVSIMLLVLVIAIALHIPISGDFDHVGTGRHSFFSQALDIFVNLSLSIGVSLLLLSSRPRGDRSGAHQ